MTPTRYARRSFGSLTEAAEALRAYQGAGLPAVLSARFGGSDWFVWIPIPAGSLAGRSISVA